MKQNDRVPPVPTSMADTGRPVHVGVRVLWGAIVGYAAVAIIAVVVDTAAGGVLPGAVIHGFGAGGAGLGALVGARSAPRRATARMPRSTDRPHDGWIN